MAKQRCTNRAEWRLPPGKPSEQLSPHYKLDCDFGTPVISIWQDGGSDPIYLCQAHAKQMGRPRKASPDIRMIDNPAEHSNSNGKGANPEQISEPAVAKPVASTPPKAAVKPVSPRIDAPAPKPDVQTDPVIESEPASLLSEPAFHSPLQAAFDFLAKTEDPVAKTEAPAGKNGDQTPVSPAAATQPAPLAPPKTATPSAAASRAERVAKETPARPPARDLTYGSPAKAMVDEAIWNMAPGDYQAYKSALQQGRPAAEAAQAAGGQIAIVHRKIDDYTMKLEALLSESKAEIKVADAIDKPLDQAVLEIIARDEMPESKKDAAIQQLGRLQEWIKHGLQANISPLRANRILWVIGDRVNWGGITDISEELKPVYRSLFTNLRSTIRAVAPEAQALQDRLANLYAAKSDLDSTYFDRSDSSYRIARQEETSPLPSGG